MVGITALALARITSSFMVITSDGQKTNLGLSLKFEAKGMKVLDYSQKSANGRGWEFSDKAIQLIRDYKVSPHVSLFFLAVSGSWPPSGQIPPSLFPTGHPWRQYVSFWSPSANIHAFVQIWCRPRTCLPERTGIPKSKRSAHGSILKAFAISIRYLCFATSSRRCKDIHSFWFLPSKFGFRKL